MVETIHNKHRLRSLWVAWFCMLLSTLAITSVAAEKTSDDIYVGIGTVFSNLEPVGRSAGYTAQKTESSGLRLFVGGYFRQRMRWELGYMDAGAAELSAPNQSAPAAEISYKLPSFSLDYLLRDPASSANVYIRAGVSAIENKVSRAEIEIQREHSANLLFGVGLEWALSERLHLRFAVETYSSDVAVASLSIVSIGRDFWGRGTARRYSQILERRRSLAAVAQLDLPPEPRAQSTVATRELRQQHHCGRLQTPVVHFERKSAELNSFAKSQLLWLASHLQGLSEATLVVRGHADSIGSTTPNRRLSRERAHASIEYLAMNTDISVANFVSTGYGESAPGRSNRTETGRRWNRRVEFFLITDEGCGID